MEVKEVHTNNVDGEIFNHEKLWDIGIAIVNWRKELQSLLYRLVYRVALRKLLICLNSGLYDVAT